MNKRSPAPARVVAVAALAVALVVAIVVIGGALGGDNSGKESGGRHHGAKTHQGQPRHVPVTYEVKSGDTLISIAHRMGVPIVRIEELNPELDPQSLIVGEQLKLREPG